MHVNDKAMLFESGMAYAVADARSSFQHKEATHQGSVGCRSTPLTLSDL